MQYIRKVPKQYKLNLTISWAYNILASEEIGVYFIL